MLVHGERKFIAAKFLNEEEIEGVVENNADYIFGPDSIYLPKKLIKSPDGVGTIPDGFVIDLLNRQWFIIEAELSIHSVWSHIAPQVAKQIIAAQQPATWNSLIEVVIRLVKENLSIQEKFDAFDLDPIDIRRHLSEIFETKAIVGLPIDSISSDLREWAQTLKSEVKLWLIRKLVEYNDPDSVIYEIPDEYKPVFDSINESSELNSTKQSTFYDVQIIDLMVEGFLSNEQKIFLSYKPKNGQKFDFEGQIKADGNIIVENHEFPSLSFAALYCIQKAGSTRLTVNGWTSWKNSDGESLAEIRSKYLEKINSLDNDGAGL